MTRILFIVACLFACVGVQAQSLSNGNNLGQTSESAASIAPGAVVIDNSNKSQPLARTELKTVGTAIAPGVYNASGTYNCFGGASAAIGVMGWGAGGGATVSQAECYRMHLMDKAKQANQPQVYAALFCQFPDGKAAYEAAGIECPVAPAKKQVAAACSADPLISARQEGCAK